MISGEMAERREGGSSHECNDLQLHTVPHKLDPVWELPEAGLNPEREWTQL
jgi:hypothetical protein